MSFQNEIWLAIRTDEDDGTGTGTPNDPFVVNTPESFSKVMGNPSTVPENSIIRLGPGVFRTRGNGGNGVTSVPSGSLWTPRSGQKMIGAGMFATTLQFDWDIVPTGVPGPRHFMVRSTDYLNSYELCDLTLDCNLQNTPFGKDPVIMPPSGLTADLVKDTPTSTTSTLNSSAAFFTSAMVGKIVYFSKDQQPLPSFNFSAEIVQVISSTQAILHQTSPESKNGGVIVVFYPRFSVTAVSLIGDNVRVRRVRCINFGTRTPLYFDGVWEASGQIKSAEGFPLRIEGRTINVVQQGQAADKPAFNSWLEDCVVEQPYPFSAREVTFVVGGGVAPNAALPNKLHLEPFAVGIRNCYMNFDFVNAGPGNPVGVGGITFSGSGSNVDATVTTYFPLYVKVDDYVEMYGNKINGNDVAALNGRFKVTAIGSAECSKPARKRARRRTRRDKQRTDCRAARQKRNRGKCIELIRLSLLLSLLIALFANSQHSLAQTDTLIVPNGKDVAFGDSLLMPWPFEHPVVQQVYASNHFSPLPRSPVIITEMAFRIDENQNSNLDERIVGMSLFLNVFRGTLEQIARNGNGYQAPLITVFHGDLRLQGRSGLTNAFDIRIPFTKPFIYDRREGHLVATFYREAGGDGAVLDAEVQPFGQGFALMFGGIREPSAATRILVTQMHYLAPPDIVEFSVSGEVLTLSFEFFGDFEALRIESSSIVSGPYLPLNGAGITRTGMGQGLATFRSSNQKQFFRINYVIP